jgi:hypothetical protein
MTKNEEDRTVNKTHKEVRQQQKKQRKMCPRKREREKKKKPEQKKKETWGGERIGGTKKELVDEWK